jgi:hypothetical protein
MHLRGAADRGEDSQAAGAITERNQINGIDSSARR